MGNNQRDFGVDRGWSKVHGPATPIKVPKTHQTMLKIANMKYGKLQTFQELVGKLQHASFGVPGGKGLFSPIHQAMHGS